MFLQNTLSKISQELKGLERYYCRVIRSHSFTSTESEAQTGFVDCASSLTRRPEVLGPLLVHVLSTHSDGTPVGVGVWEPQDPKVTHEQETVAFTQFKYQSTH